MRTVFLTGNLGKDAELKTGKSGKPYLSFSVGSTERKYDGTKETVSFLGIVPIWYKAAGISYTQDEPASMFMAASAEYDDIFTVSILLCHRLCCL